MEQWRRLEISDISAHHLKKVKRLQGMKVYVVVSVSGNPISEHNASHETPVNTDGSTDPSRTTLLGFNLHNPNLEANRLFLNFKFYRERTLRQDCYVGGATVPIHQLFRQLKSTDKASAPPVPRWTLFTPEKFYAAMTSFLPSSSSGATQGLVKDTATGETQGVANSGTACFPLHGYSAEAQGSVKFSFEFFPLTDYPHQYPAVPKPKPTRKRRTAGKAAVIVAQGVLEGVVTALVGSAIQ